MDSLRLPLARISEAMSTSFENSLCASCLSGSTAVKVLFLFLVPGVLRVEAASSDMPTPAAAMPAVDEEAATSVGMLVRPATVLTANWLLVRGTTNAEFISEEYIAKPTALTPDIMTEAFLPLIPDALEPMSLRTKMPGYTQVLLWSLDLALGCLVGR